MNQKGFATVLGLCLIMAIVLCVKGIQEAETNHAYATTDFQTEIDLQNAAESGIYAALETFEATGNYPPLMKDVDRSGHQVTFSTTLKGNISVDVRAERVLIFPYKVNYGVIVSNKYRADKSGDGKEAYILFSRAEIDSERIGRKLFRHAFAYVELDESGKSKNEIRFMDVASNDIFYRPVEPDK